MTSCFCSVSVSEMKKITQRMAIDEWESPGINRRLYDQKVLKKQRSNASTVRTEEVGFENPGFDDISTSPNPTNAPSTEQTTIITNAIVETPPCVPHSVHDIPPSLYSKHSTRNKDGAVFAKLEMQTSDSGVDVESIQQDGATSSYSSPATNPRILTKDRGGSLNSTQSEPAGVTGSNPSGVKGSNPSLTLSNKHTSANHTHSVRIETSRNAWQSAETLVKIHVDVLELLNESAMLGPYCLQSKIKRSKLRSSERPPTLKFSARENRFIARRTSFDDLDAYYLDFSKPIIDQITSSDESKGKTSNLESDTYKPDMAGLEGPWNSRSMSSFQDDLTIYSQLLLRKHEEDETKATNKPVSDINHNDESTSL